MNNIIIFDEKKYAQRIIELGYYQTLKFQGKERRAVAKYMRHDLGYNDFEIRSKMSKIKSKRKEIFEDDVWHAVMSKILDRFDKYDYMKDIKVGISKTELDIILTQPTIELRNLLFVLTVYFKWARATNERLCMRHTDTWVKEADLDCCKIAGLKATRKSDRYKLFHILEKGSKVYKSDFIRKYNEIFTLTFIDDKKPVIIIDDYEDILAHLENYLNNDSCIKCSKCGALTLKSSNVKHLCKWCSSNRKHRRG